MPSAPPARGWQRYVAIACGAVLVAALIAFILATVVEASRSSNERLTQVLERVEAIERANAAEVLAHRAAVQGDHDRDHKKTDCILRLLVVIEDPERDLNTPPRLPDGCEVTVAKDEARKEPK
jgi:hypothetical protein